MWLENYTAQDRTKVCSYLRLLALLDPLVGTFDPGASFVPVFHHYFLDLMPSLVFLDCCSSCYRGDRWVHSHKKLLGFSVEYEGCWWGRLEYFHWEPLENRCTTVPLAPVMGWALLSTCFERPQWPQIKWFSFRAYLFMPVYALPIIFSVASVEPAHATKCITPLKRQWKRRLNIIFCFCLVLFSLRSLGPLHWIMSKKKVA